jgi:hypothetical protein
MKKSDSIVLFNQKQVRRIWDETKELWYFSIIRLVAKLEKNLNKLIPSLISYPIFK